NFCLSYADQVVQHGFPALVVLGGDKHVGRPRCVEHAWQLRRMVRERHPELELGGWANPAGDPARQVAFVSDGDFSADFYLTQIVSHHDIDPVARFIERADQRGVELPGVFGVFYYRSANPRTLALLSDFIPVPGEALQREFSGGASAEDVCACTIRAVAALGVRRFYISNLPLVGTARVLARIRERAALA
ncbi:MAG TPA: hypothetical protein VK911_03600, partial [Vicinamibacterales bacterium]|nr:hypothetical protein [Vicinamibacterales bacterium]